MAPAKPSRARFLTAVAATVISLACGTNYVYSAWAPQFAQHLQLSATQANLIGTFGNLGMYVTGIPLGMMVDKYGPRSGVALGVVLFALGYYPLAKAFDAGPGAFSVTTLCLFSWFTGAGSNAAFLAAIKVVALNYPDARGTATAFPLAAFGLSAFAFATVALALPHDTPHFLMLLAAGTVVLPTVSFPFVRVLPSSQYKTVSQHDRQALHRTKSSDSTSQINRPDSGAQTNIPKPPLKTPHSSRQPEVDSSDETSSLLSDTSSADMADLETCKSIDSDSKLATSLLDVRGFALIRHIEFWQLFCTLGLMTGIGLMTINNIGNDATALWRHYDSSKDSAFIAKRQAMHVSILSVGSFTGRLLSGIGSDILVKKYNRSRLWCVLISAGAFTIAQVLAIVIELPTLLVFVSGLTGLAYGILFGVFPSIIAHTFGVHGLSQNWGTMCLAPVISGNIFNILYGRIYDSRSIVEANGDRDCIEGGSCYRAAYMVTLGAGVASIFFCLWSIHHENKIHNKMVNSVRGIFHERVA